MLTETLFVYGIIGIFVGARLGHCLFYDFSVKYWKYLEIFLPVKIGEKRTIYLVGSPSKSWLTIGLIIHYFYIQKIRNKVFKILS
jgi:hypothetical protein